MKQYEALSQPFTIGRMRLKNRIVMPAMGTGFSTVDGEVTPQLLRYYERRARGGAGMIVVEIACVDAPRGRVGFTQLGADKPQFVPGLSELVDVIHAYDCKAAVQLHHAGRQTMPLVTGQPVVAPSPIACKFMKSEPQELTAEEIQQLIVKFVTSAFICRNAGFDAVELHAAHGYLLAQFLSPYTNQRTDEYGGSTEKRARMLLDIIKGIKANVRGITVGVRLNLTDFLPQGLELEEGLQIAEMVEAAGADYINVSGGIYESGLTTIEPASYQEGWRLYLAEALRQRVKTPLIAGGVIRHPAFADDIIKSGKADLVWVGRGMLADPDWPAKALNGREDDIRPCISCNTCIGNTFDGKAVRCAVNPLAGREWRLEDENIRLEGRRIAVVGGGPAGMQAALSLSAAGARVDLFEQASELGGRLNVAARPPFKDKLQWLIDYFIHALEQSPVEVHLETEFDPEKVREGSFDLVVAAGGAKIRNIIIPGLAPEQEIFAEALLLDAAEELPANAAVAVIGGGTTGCEVAEFLADKGCRVTIIEAGRAIARGMENMTQLDMMLRLKAKSVRIMKQCKVTGVQGNLLQLQKGEEAMSLEFDKAVITVGYTGDNTLSAALAAAGLPNLCIGDAADARNIQSAIYEGRMSAARIASMLG